MKNSCYHYNKECAIELQCENKVTLKQIFGGKCSFHETPQQFKERQEKANKEMESE